MRIFCAPLLHCTAALRPSLRNSSSAAASASSPAARAGPLPAYAALLASQRLLPDPAQRSAVAALQRLHDELLPPPPPTHPHPQQPRSPSAPRGIYLHGGVGRGKTYLMDLFFASLPAALGVRAHSHAFFLDLHAAMHARGIGGVQAVASATAAALAGARVLCLDEVEVSDIADAVLLRRVYSALRAEGVALVATSNRAPHRLYEKGLNRSLLFLPFERELLASAELVCLDEPASEGSGSGSGGAGAQGRDYRSSAAAPASPATSASAARPSAPPPSLLLHRPSPAAAAAALDAAAAALLPPGGARLAPLLLPLPALGRSLRVPAASPCRTLARYSFAELCGPASAASAADYYALARAFPALALEGVPPPRARSADDLRRLVTLVDILYEARTLVLASSSEPLEALLVEAGGVEAAEAARERARWAQAQAAAVAAGGAESGVRAQGGSSGRSTLFLGAVEWSATGRAGASLAEVGGGGAGAYVAAAAARAGSRLRQMLQWGWAEEWGQRRGVGVAALREALRGGAGGG